MISDARSIVLAIAKQATMLTRVKFQAREASSFAATRSMSNSGQNAVLSSSKAKVTHNHLLVYSDALA